MLYSVLLGLAVLFFLFVPLGINTNIFLIYGIGLTGAGLSFVLFSLIVKNNWEGFKRLQQEGSHILVWLYRLFIFGIGVVILIGASGFWLDLPAYLNKDYSRLEGVPSEIEYEEPSRGEIQGTVMVTINSIRLPLTISPRYHPEELKYRRLTIYYLPNTQWIINYQIEMEKF